MCASSHSHQAVHWSVCVCMFVCVFMCVARGLNACGTEFLCFQEFSHKHGICVCVCVCVCVHGLHQMSTACQLCCHLKSDVIVIVSRHSAMNTRQ